MNSTISNKLAIALWLTASLLMTGCKQDDPEPVNEEEVITTLEVALTPRGGGAAVTLRFFDEDGELGSTAPVVTVSGPLAVQTIYDAEIILMNETVSPPIDISEEVEEEGDHHLFCFTVEGETAIEYADEDQDGKPLGLLTSWHTGDAGSEKVTVSLRHQAGTKTGDCPGAGETDVEVTFGISVE